MKLNNFYFILFFFFKKNSDEPPKLNDDNDPKGWFRKYARDYVLDVDEHARFLRITDTGEKLEPIDCKKLHSGDIVQIRVTFEPYQSRLPKQDDYIGGIRMLMHEVVRIRGHNEIISLQVIHLNIARLLC